MLLLNEVKKLESQVCIHGVGVGEDTKGWIC